MSWQLLTDPPAFMLTANGIHVGYVPADDYQAVLQLLNGLEAMVLNAGQNDGQKDTSPTPREPETNRA
jgi:hypothetical protein